MNDFPVDEWNEKDGTFGLWGWPILENGGPALKSGLEQLTFLEEQVSSLLERYQGICDKNRELEGLLGAQQDKVQQLEEMLKNKDILLATVESRIDRLLGKLSDFDSPVPDTPLLPGTEIH